MNDQYFEVALCPVCRDNRRRKKYKVTYFNDDILSSIGVTSHIPDTFINECQTCFHTYASPQLTEEALDNYYSQINSEYYLPEDLQTDKLYQQHKQVVDTVEKYIESGNVLEIGCGYGYLLNLFDKKRWNCVGVEPFGKACDFARDKLGVNVINGYLTKDTFPEKENFDIIMLFDVMEHLKNAQYMKELIDYYLKPNGLLIIGTGDISSSNAKISREKWAYLTLREHVSFFSKNSIKHWAEPYVVVDYVRTSYIGNSFSNFLNLLQNLTVRRVYNLVQKIHYPITKFTVTRFPFVRYILAFDHMLAVFRKPIS